MFCVQFMRFNIWVCSSFTIHYHVRNEWRMWEHKLFLVPYFSLHSSIEIARHRQPLKHKFQLRMACRTIQNDSQILIESNKIDDYCYYHCMWWEFICQKAKDLLEHFWIFIGIIEWYIIRHFKAKDFRINWKNTTQRTNWTVGVWGLMRFLPSGT